MSLRVRQIRYTSATIKRIGSQVNDQASILSRNVNPNGTIHVPGARRGRYEQRRVGQTLVGRRRLCAANYSASCMRSLGENSLPTFAHGRSSTITTSAVKSFSPRI